LSKNAGSGFVLNKTGSTTLVFSIIQYRISFLFYWWMVSIVNTGTGTFQFCKKNLVKICDSVPVTFVEMFQKANPTYRYFTISSFFPSF
jgi:hypothetical protein